LDRGPDPGKVWAFGSDSRGHPPDVVEVRANGVHPLFDAGQPRVRLGQALVQTGGDAGNPAVGLRRDPPTEANRRGAQQHADDPEHNGADAQSWSHEPTRNRIPRTQTASPGDVRDRLSTSLAPTAPGASSSPRRDRIRNPAQVRMCSDLLPVIWSTRNGSTSLY